MTNIRALGRGRRHRRLPLPHRDYVHRFYAMTPQERRGWSEELATNIYADPLVFQWPNHTKAVLQQQGRCGQDRRRLHELPAGRHVGLELVTPGLGRMVLGCDSVGAQTKSSKQTTVLPSSKLCPVSRSRAITSSVMRGPRNFRNSSRKARSSSDNAAEAKSIPATVAPAVRRWKQSNPRQGDAQ